MSCFWTYLSLIVVLQHSVSADQAVELNCNKTVKVQAGGTATLNCSIHWNEDINTSKNLTSITWTNCGKSELCHSNMKRYVFESDNQTYVSLTISNVYEAENVNVDIVADGGMDDKCISVVVVNGTDPATSSSYENHDNPKDDTVVIASTLSVLGAVLVGVILFVLYKVKTRNNHRRLEQKEPQPLV